MSEPSYPTITELQWQEMCKELRKIFQIFCTDTTCYCPTIVYSYKCQA